MRDDDAFPRKMEWREIDFIDRLGVRPSDLRIASRYYRFIGKLWRALDAMMDAMMDEERANDAGGGVENATGRRVENRLNATY